MDLRLAIDLLSVIGMDFYEVIKQRKSVRRYTAQQVPEDALMRVLEAARIAPSWKNLQCWRFVVVDDPEQIAKAFPTVSKVHNAPMYIVVCANPEQSGHKDGKDYYLVDAAIAMEHIVLAAAAEGLGTCWLGAAFDEAVVKFELGLPQNLRVVAVTPLGYAAEGVGGFVGNTVVRAISSGSGRKPMGEIAFRNLYGMPLGPDDK